MDERAVRQEIAGTPTEDALLAVADAGGEAIYSTLEKALGEDLREVATLGHHMQELGLAERPPTMVDEVRLTGAGRRVAASIRERRAPGGADRAEMVQRALLRWLAAGGHPSSVTDFVSHPDATAYGVPFTEEEIQDASDYLTKRELIASSGLWGVTSGVKPRITTEGRAALRAEVPVSEYGALGAGGHYDYSNRTTITGGTVGGVQTGGQGNAQTISMTLRPDQRTQVVTILSDLIRRLDESGHAEPALRGNLLEAAAEAEKEDATPGGLRNTLMTALVTAGTTKGVDFVAHGLANALGIVSG